MQFTLRNEKQDGLCAVCSHSTVVEGDAMNQRVVVCGEIPTEAAKAIRFPVRRCSAFNEKNKPDEFQMRQIAWIIETDKRDRSFVGFRPPKDRGVIESE